MTIPLFSVPHPVLAEVFNHIPTAEIVSLSLCSKYSYLLIKLFRNEPKNPGFLLVEGHRLGFWIEKEDFLGDYFVSKKPTNTEAIQNFKNYKNIPCEFDELGRLSTYWEDTVLGFKLFTEYTADLFGVTVSRIIIGTTDAAWMIDWVNEWQRGTTVKTVHADMLEVINEEEYCRFLRSKPTRSLFIGAQAPQNFQFEKLPVVETLSLRSSYWVTLDHLLTMEIKNFSTYTKSKFNTSDVNTFLKHWLVGGSPRLRYLCLEIENLSMDDVFQGLEDRVALVQRPREYEWVPEAILNFNVGHDITRDNGVTATFVRCASWTVELGWTGVIIVDWPDINGNSFV